MEFTRTERGRKMLIMNGYLYIQERCLPTKTIWKCRQWHKYQCKGRLHVFEEKILKSASHNHVPDAAKVNVAKQIGDMKKKALTTSSSTRNLIAETVANISESSSGQAPTIRSMKRTIQRCRNQAQSHPNNPRTLSEFDLAKQYTVTCDGLKFLLKDIGRSSNNRILIFGTDYSLDLLVSCSHWFADGTFKTVPLLFTQLYTIHVMKYGEVLPALYILMCHRTEAVYTEILRELKVLRPGLNPISILIDFERAAISSFSKEFPAAKVKGCFFHFSQCLWRKLQEVGLQCKYSKDSEFSLQVRMLNAIAFVPTCHVTEAFEALQDSVYYEEHNEELSPLIDYFEDVWIGRVTRRGQRKQPLFPHEMWNHFDSINNEIAKTNNSVEGWHTAFATLLEAHHSTIYKFIDGLKKDEILTRHRIRELECGNAASSSKKCYRDTSERIKKIVSEFTTRPVINYLRAIAHNFQLQV